jgi:hypothetical protein
MSNAKSTFGTQHVTKNPEATKSGGIHGNPEYFEGREDIEVCSQRQMAFSNEKQLKSAETRKFVSILSPICPGFTGLLRTAVVLEHASIGEPARAALPACLCIADVRSELDRVPWCG